MKRAFYYWIGRRKVPNTKRTPLSCIYAVAFCALAPAYATTVRTPVSTIKPLLLEALANGEAHGVLVGKAQAVSKLNFQTDAPIEVDVKRVASHPQPGCARLAVTTRQADVVLPAQNGMPPSQPRAMQMRYRIDYCNLDGDGSFPQGEQRK